MDLPFEDEKLIKSFVLLHYDIIVANLYNWFLKIPFDSFIAALGNSVPLKIEVFPCLIWNLNSFLSSMIVAKPFPDVVAIINIGPENKESLRKWLLALEAFFFILTGHRFSVIEKYLDFIFEFLVEEVL